MELKINNKTIRYFNGFEVSLRFDAIASGFSFDLYFNPDNPEHKAILKPGQYLPCEVTHLGQTLITGTLLSPGFESAEVDKLVRVSGYSTPGVLEDCQIPLSAYPLQSDGVTLRQIATKMLRPFGLSFVVDSAVASDMDKVFSSSTAGDRQSVRAYLAELAVQRNIVLTHDERGRVVFTRANTNQTPVLNLSGEMKPSTARTLSVNGQAMHSEITVQRQASATGGNAGQSTVTNPYVASFRPKVINQTSGNDTDTDKAAKAALSTELKNISLTVEIDRWDVDGEILRPGSVITVTDPKLYLYSRTRWFVDEVTYKGDNVTTTATLKCVLPEVYNGKAPTNIFA